MAPLSLCQSQRHCAQITWAEKKKKQNLSSTDFSKKFCNSMYSLTQEHTKLSILTQKSPAVHLYQLLIHIFHQLLDAPVRVTYMHTTTTGSTWRRCPLFLNPDWWSLILLHIKSWLSFSKPSQSYPHPQSFLSLLRTVALKMLPSLLQTLL